MNQAIVQHNFQKKKKNNNMIKSPFLDPVGQKMFNAMESLNSTQTTGSIREPTCNF